MRIKSFAVSGVALLTLGGALAGCKDSGSDAAAPTATQATSAAAAPTESATATATGTASAAAGNGVAGLTAAEIVTKAKAALKDAKSFRAKGTTTEDGQKLNLDMEVRGTDALGRLSVGTATVELLSVGGKQYMKPNAAFWTTLGGLKAAEAKTVIALMGNRWLIVKKKGGDLSSFFESVKVDEILKPAGTVTKVAGKQIGDYPTVGVKDSKGGTLYVATTGAPYPIRIDGGADGSFAFSDFGKTFTDLKKPADAEVVDLNQ
ncbi:hypothetical protein ODJ79_11105 [Actinoplanes sp. KI2]|uniref:hypothetical protein n=1 Tax=Actinoplanes sp. KI2 TaxID=2983315 RepID=UPI0021D59ACD|nr:hypothetical protein [Actinoplanes sp. KI2]MCU7724263.1 hypothetical protein [Actinoplanes sp. KI2]